MRFEQPPGSAAIAFTGLRIEIGKERLDFREQFLFEAVFDLRPGQKAFRGEPFGEDHLVAVKEKVHIGHLATFNLLDPIAAQQLFGRRPSAGRSTAEAVGHRHG